MNCILMNEFNFFRERYSDAKIKNDYLLSMIVRYNEEFLLCKEERCKEEADDDNDIAYV